IMKKFPEMLYIDLTYKTNRFNIPFYQANSLTGYNTTFSYFFSIVKINNEQREAFNFLFQAIKDIRRKNGIPDPEVIIIDTCKEIKARAFP
ncbi:hypothetical protein QBC44DRAFT_252466, partial [Cladorrhinum sp. PSN332]